MKSTIKEFWKMVVKKKCGAIVMLSQLDERGKVSHKSAITVKFIDCKYQVYCCKEACGMCDSVISKKYTSYSFMYSDFLSW